MDQSAKWHATLDFNFTFDSITYETIKEDGPYIFITGIVTFADDDENKYHGDYSVTLTETDEEDNYKVLSWELGELKTENGEPVDFFVKLYDYVIREGEYDKTDKVSYIYATGSSANETLFLIAENDGSLRYWYVATYKTSSYSFSLFYECTFNKGEKPRFELDYGYVDEYYNGIAISGETAHVTGQFDADGENYTISTEEYNGCDKNPILTALEDCHEQGLNLIEKTMSAAGIGCTLEQLIN